MGKLRKVYVYMGATIDKGAYMLNNCKYEILI